MKLTRKEWLKAACTLPLQFTALAQLTAQGPGGNRGAAPTPLPPLGPAPALPDKTSFPRITGTSLDAAATHPRPEGSLDLIRKAQASQLGEPSGFRSNEARVRENFARLVNADPTEIAIVPATQIGESYVVAALGISPENHDHIVSDHLHFVGSLQMYTDMTRRGLDVTWIEIKDNRIPDDELDRAIVKGRTKLVAISHTSFVTGFQHDLKRVSDIAHAKGAMVYADIIQAAGNQPLDLTASGVDAAACATYKWLMSAGTAFLYVRKSAMQKMRPPFYHFTRYTTLLPTTHMYPFDAPAREIVDNYTVKEGAPGMFSTGYEPDTAALAGLEYSLPYIMNIGPAKIQAHAQALTDRLKAELPRRGYPLLTPQESRAPIVTVAVENAQRLGADLRAAGVRVTTRWNHVRISPSVFNDMHDVDRLLAALPKI